ncbi:YbaB/EbfC family DNA-binding protein [Nocardia blacklockiae]|uniref:YbaB/EbfC family DNA-binding protein n=1 Tax=Nocardia blacklockiae TaxID=480036 RepID=UPI001892EC83|nr:YbaB/EbfC family DNA-binding protein [Nocardia blacklockiae]MBF6171403.1 YbaB/EbfC family DNA-binding protein [Nocardia blacklockiae]
MVDTMDELIARVQKQLYRLRDLDDAMKGVRASATSADGAITVAVDGNGAPVEMSFTGGISKLSPEEFERELVGTARAAAVQAFSERADLVTAFNEESAG